MKAETGQVGKVPENKGKEDQRVTYTIYTYVYLPVWIYFILIHMHDGVRPSVTVEGRSYTGDLVQGDPEGVATSVANVLATRPSQGGQQAINWLATQCPEHVGTTGR